MLKVVNKIKFSTVGKTIKKKCCACCRLACGIGGAGRESL